MASLLTNSTPWIESAGAEALKLPPRKKSVLDEELSSNPNDNNSNNHHQKGQIVQILQVLKIHKEDCSSRKISRRMVHILVHDTVTSIDLVVYLNSNTEKEEEDHMKFCSQMKVGTLLMLKNYRFACKLLVLGKFVDHKVCNVRREPVCLYTSNGCDGVTVMGAGGSGVVGDPIGFHEKIGIRQIFADMYAFSTSRNLCSLLGYHNMYRQL